MKKITGFFLALLPIFVIILLFVTGMLIKDYTHIFVTSVELNSESWSEQAEDLSTEPTYQLIPTVLPLNATNPEVYYVSTDENILTVDSDGLVTYKDYGEASIYAVSKENQTIKDKCDFDIWDTRLHRIEVKNEFLAGYVGFNQSFNLGATPVPAKHLEGTPVFSYTSSKEEVATVDGSGNVTAKEQPGTTTITIHESTWDITTTVDVTVGVGVNAIDFAHPNNTTIQEQTYNLYDDIITYPETKNNVPASDFTFTSSNPNVAKIDDDGLITFYKPEQATFNVEYKRKPFKISKSIDSTCNSFDDILFNRYSYVANYEDFAGGNPYIDPKVLNWHIYPEQGQGIAQKIDVTSSDATVVEVTNDNRLYVHKPGSVYLYATIHENSGTKMDMCSIVINSNETSFVKEPTVQVNDNFCYYLRNNIRTEKLADPNQKITWTLNSDIAYVDEFDILHFKQATETAAGLLVTAQFPGTGVTESFHVKCAPITTKEVNVSSRQLVLKVGQRYHFSDKSGYEWYPSDASKFDVISDFGYTYFIPKEGCNIRECEFYSEGVIPSYLYSHVIITQEPLGIWYDTDKMVYATAKPTVHFSEICSILPKTATKPSGEKYELDVDYRLSDRNNITVSEDGIMTFNKPGYVEAIASADGFASKKIFVRSTCGAAGKFSMVKEDGTTQVQSGDSLTLNPGESQVYYLNDIYTADAPITDELLNQFVVKSRNNTNIITSTKEIVTDGSGNSTIKFTITANEDARDSDVIVIESGNFNFYLNLTVTDKVHDYALFYKGKMLDDANATTTYINTLQLDILTNPIKLIENKPTVTLNGGSITVSDDLKIDLTNKLRPNNNELVLTSAEGFSKTYSIVLKSIDEINSFTIQEADDTDIYIQTGGLQKTLNINVDGIVDEQFFNDKFTINFTSKASEQAQQKDGKIYLSSLPIPTLDEPGYENTISVSLASSQGTITNTYNLHRDIVSRIVLPKHDNNDPDDAKGLQKVHVYGDESYYTKEEGKKNFYKLPFELYDYKNELITDETIKKQVFDTLDCQITGPSTAVYHAPDEFNEQSFIEVHFDNSQKYNVDQIYNDEFADPTKQHNPTFSLSTKSKFVEAHYTFVPVHGINAFCSEGIVLWQNIVLQTNFGLDSKDSVPFTDPDISGLTNIYGNGYTINFDARARAYITLDLVGIYVDSWINVTVQGCNDDILNLSNVESETNQGGETTWFAYTIFKNLNIGLKVWICPEAHVKNCLFYNNKTTSIHVGTEDENKPKIYIENSIFFNCSSVAMDSMMGTQVYLKGFIDVYNFKNRDILKNIFGMDLTWLWDTFISMARERHMTQMGPDGREYVNSSMATLLGGGVFFWNGEEYVLGEKGNPLAADHLQPYVDLWVPIIDNNVTLWGTPQPEYEHGSPSYYDEYDGEGKLRWDFLNNQISKLSRVQNFWWRLS